MSEAAPHTGREHATDRVLHDLVDMVLAENLLGAADWAIVSARAPGAALQRFPLDDGELWLALPLADDTQLAWRVRRALFPRPWRLSRPPVLAVRAGGVTAVPLEPAEVVRALRGRQRPGPVWPAVDLVATDLADVPAFTARADDAAPAVLDALVGPGAAPTLAEGEQVAALGDWPFHPLGRHKRGWDADDARRWGPHAPAAFGLAWWAVPRGWVRCGTGRAGGAGGPAADVLGERERDVVAGALADRGLGDDHVVLPVHPWQARRLAEPAAQAGAVRLADDLGAFRATASLRTLVPVDHPGVHLKLPLGVAALGASRELPVRDLRNGDHAQQLLSAVAAHPALAGRIHVCDETTWWVTEASGDECAGPGEGDLGAQVRRYPPGTVDDPAVTLLPLAALGVAVEGRAPAVEAVLARSDAAAGPTDASAGTAAAGPAAGPTDDPGSALLAELTAELVRLAVVGLAHGVMPEAHGQNVVVVLRAGRVEGLVLRDHDTVRVHPPGLAAAGLPDPGYVVDTGTPDTLVAGSPEELLVWFQMLGVHVGLHPVARALAATGHTDEAAGWRTIADTVAATLAELEPAADLRPAVALARRRLLETPLWPVTSVLGPLLERGATCGTSMPSGVAWTTNPLRPPAARATR